MKKWFYSYNLLIGLLVLVICILVSTNFFFLHKKKLAQTTLIQLAEQEGRKSMIIDLLTGNMKMHYTYNERHLSDFDVVTPEKQRIKLSSLLDDEYKVVFKYSSTNCSSCINSELEHIIKLSRHVPKNRIIVLGEFTNRRQFLASMKGHSIDFPVYQLETKAFGDLLEKENVPFFFLINKELQVQDLFIPMKELPDFTDLYYQAILKKYFDF